MKGEATISEYKVQRTDLELSTLLREATEGSHDGGNLFAYGVYQCMMWAFKDGASPMLSEFWPDDDEVRDSVARVGGNLLVSDEEVEELHKAAQARTSRALTAEEIAQGILGADMLG